MGEPQFLTIPEFCAEYRTSRSNTFVLLREGRLKGIKIGKMTRIRREDAQAWAAALPPAGRATSKPKMKLQKTWDRRPNAEAAVEVKKVKVKVKVKVKARARTDEPRVD